MSDTETLVKNSHVKTLFGDELLFDKKFDSNDNDCHLFILNKSKYRNARLKIRPLFFAFLSLLNW